MRKEGSSIIFTDGGDFIMKLITFNSLAAAACANKTAQAG